MTAITMPASRIRKVNVREDLLAVADLIEICFASTLDDDGREYLRHLRWAARDMNYLSWIQGAAERVVSPLYGFVWEENGRVVGNLSLIPVYRPAGVVYLIANVAVHPDFRRRGIARALTQTALDHLKERGVDTAWLQVRDDNPAAYQLYLSLGFVERARRTTWQISPGTIQRPSLPQGVTVIRRRAADWNVQERWLLHTYPPDISWNMAFSLSRLSPNIFGRFLRWARGELQEQWEVLAGQRPLGFVAWEPMRSSSDVLWLAVDPQYEAQAVHDLLIHARLMLSNRKRPLSVNYPAGRGDDAFYRAGFSTHQTLIWMSAALRSR